MLALLCALKVPILVRTCLWTPAACSVSCLCASRCLAAWRVLGRVAESVEVWGRRRGGCVFHIGLFLRLLAWDKSRQLLLGWGVAPGRGLAARGAGFAFPASF